eukprot:c12748_g1_i1 orf=191-409(-)
MRCGGKPSVAESISETVFVPKLLPALTFYIKAGWGYGKTTFHNSSRRKSEEAFALTPFRRNVGVEIGRSRQR